MRFIFNFIYFILFSILAIIVLFAGGIFGVAGTFYLMVESGDLQTNLIHTVAPFVVVWLLLILLRGRNKREIWRNQRNKQQQIEANNNQ
jgi:uncharacterized protein HemY